MSTRLKRWTVAAVTAITISAGIVIPTVSAQAVELTSSATELGQMLVAHHEAGDLVTNPSSIYTNEIAPYANGTPSSGCQVDVRILQVLELAIRHTGSVTVSDIQRPCIGSSLNCGAPNYSVHCAQPGAAIDISVAGGTVLTGNDDVSRSIIADLDPVVPSGTNLGQVQCRSANPVSTANFNQFSDTCNHLHIDFRNTAAPLAVTAPAPADAGVVQMIRDGGGQIWAKAPLDYSNGNWGQQTPAGITKMATGGGTQAILDGGGNVWAKRSLGNGGWSQETQGGGIKSIAVSSNGTQMILDNAGTVWAKAPNAALDMTWVRETPVSNGIAQIAIGGATQVMVDASGVIWGKNNSVALGGWSQISSTTSVKQIAVGSNGWVMMLDAAGTVWAKTSNTFDNATWSRETAVGANTQYISTNGGVQALIDAGGQAWVRTSIGIDGWTPQTAGGQNKKVVVGSNGSQMILTTDGIVYVKQPNAVFSQNWNVETPAGILDIAIG